MRLRPKTPQIQHRSATGPGALLALSSPPARPRHSSATDYRSPVVPPSWSTHVSCCGRTYAAAALGPPGLPPLCLLRPPLRRPLRFPLWLPRVLVPRIERARSDLWLGVGVGVG